MVSMRIPIQGFDDKNDKATDISKIQRGDISKGVAHKLEFYDFSRAFSLSQKEARMILIICFPEESCNISLQKFVGVLDRSNPEDITALGKNT